MKRGAGGYIREYVGMVVKGGVVGTGAEMGRWMSSVWRGEWGEWGE